MARTDWLGLQRVYDWVLALALPLSILCVTSRTSARKGPLSEADKACSLHLAEPQGLTALAIGLASCSLEQAGYTEQERADDLSLSPCYETMSLQIGSVGRDGVLVPFKANARHIRNVKQSVADFIRSL